MNPEQYAHISDQQLLENFHRDKDNQWLGILLQRYTILLFGVGMKYLNNADDARDLVQVVFLKAITELQKYKVDNFKPWIYQVAKTTCLMKLRKKNGRTTELKEEQTIFVGTDYFESLEMEQKMQLMDESIHDLNEEQKQCVTLFYLEKKSYSEIAEATGYPITKVKSSLQNGRRNLRIAINKKLEG